MQTLHFTIQINANKEKVWDTMLGAETYKQWADTFMPGSHYVGSWEKYSKIQFLSADETGKLSGMTSTIVDNVLNEFISIKHLGVVDDGVEDTTSVEAKKWVGFENYTFKETDGITELVIDVDVIGEYKTYFQEVWPKALQKLKYLSEK